MKIAIIGGGSAGFMAAITAKSSDSSAEVVLFEKSDKVLSKVKISGGGRCNVTHASFNISELTRPKKVLLNKKEISKVSIKIKNNGYTIVPLDLHFNAKGFIKVLLGISKGRKKQDLREYKKKQDWKRDKEKLGRR